MATILLTGGAGFIGSHLAEMMLSQGHRLIIVDNLSTGKREQVPAGAHFVEMDINDPELERVFEAHRPSIVSHHAAQVDVRKSMDDPAFDTRVNYFGTLNLLDCCRRHPVSQFIFASSGGAVYGDDVPHPTPEEAAPHPLSIYGINKWCGEQLILAYAAKCGFIPTLLRYANVYGPRQNPHGEAGVIAIFMDRLSRGAIASIHGDGAKTRDFVYVEDLVRINAHFLLHPEAGAFNAGTGVATSIRRLAELILEAMEIHAEIPHGPDKPGEQLVSVLDSTKVAARLGGFRFTPLAEGLARMVQSRS